MAWYRYDGARLEESGDGEEGYTCYAEGSFCDNDGISIENFHRVSFSLYDPGVHA